MSPYGYIASPISSSSSSQQPLQPILYRLPDETKNLAVIPLKESSIPNELVIHLQEIFNAVIREGRTYPQEHELSLEDFKNYFLSHDLFLGVLIPNEMADNTTQETKDLPFAFFLEIQSKLGNQAWSSIIAGSYYIKPNYPGRSSHCCNGGFVVDPKHRNLKIGRTLGKSYLHYAPKLGYKFSVFNLVYQSNTASVKLWDSLGFTRAGLVPKSARIKTVDGKGEEFVDSILYWKDLSAA